MANTWGNGPATSAGSDQWNDGGAAGNWNDGGDTNGFTNDAQPAGEFGVAGFGDAGTGAGGSGGCFNCGEEGHMKSDCPNPRVERPFDGQCRICEQTGHRAADCPSKPPKTCKQCGQENPDHTIEECKAKKLIDDSAVPTITEQEAWAMIQEASSDRDVDDFKDAVKALAKAKGYEMSYLNLEKELRKRSMSFYLVALEKEVAPGYINVDLTNDAGKKYTLGVFKSEKCPRPILMESWPKDPADNLERLADAGIPLESGVVICSNCKELGHSRKACPEESTKPEPVQATCTNCGAQGHRLRDCDQDRPERKERGPRQCRYCDSEDHIAKDCDQKDAKTECRNCYEMGHRSGDCTNEKVLKCDNCDTIGHLRRECPQPRDWSRVTCRHCGEKGHGSENRCNAEVKAAFQAAKAEKDGGDGDGGVDNGFDNGFGGGDCANGFKADAGNDFSSGGDDWNARPEPIAVGGGSGW